jgi:hypothetical protein
MGHQNFHVLSVAYDTGVQTASVTGTGSVAIPTMLNGVKPKYVVIGSYGLTQTDVVFISPQHSATAAAAATGFPLPVSSGNRVILNVIGYSHIGYDATGATGVSFNIVPLEDF